LRWNKPYLRSDPRDVCRRRALRRDTASVFEDLSNFVFDTWQRLKPRTFERDGPVRIVAIDEASLAELGQWPWPRTRLAQATRHLAELGAAAIAFDIIFNEPDRASAESVIATLSSGALREGLAAQLLGAETNESLREGAGEYARRPQRVAASRERDARPRAQGRLCPCRR
jgi:CHASE2 domain-containing sensor protein